MRWKDYFHSIEFNSIRDAIVSTCHIQAAVIARKTHENLRVRVTTPVIFRREASPSPVLKHCDTISIELQSASVFEGSASLRFFVPCYTTSRHRFHQVPRFPRATTPHSLKIPSSLLKDRTFLRLTSSSSRNFDFSASLHFCTSANIIFLSLFISNKSNSMR